MTDEAMNVDAVSATEEEVSLRDTIKAEFERSSTPPVEENVAAPVGEDAGDMGVEAATQEADAREDNRDEKGRFKAKEGDAGPAAEVQDGGEQEAAQYTDETAASDKYAGPPPGWSVASKAAFDELPESVRADIAKREREIDQGFAKLKEYKPLERFVETAKQHGMEPAEFFESYRRAEEYLQRDPQNAILWLCQNYGVDPSQIGGQKANEQTADAQQADPAMQPLLQEINSLKQQLARVNTLEQTVYGEKQAQATSKVEAFFSDPKNKFAENVAPQMLGLIQQANASGQPVDLNQIYETACYMNPEVRDALIKERLNADAKAKAAKAKQAADQARQAGASITGGPTATQAGAEPDSENLRALLEQNYAAMQGRT